jgi:hypothetical protein
MMSVHDDLLELRLQLVAGIVPSSLSRTSGTNNELSSSRLSGLCRPFQSWVPAGS